MKDDCTEYLSKEAAAERLGLSVRRVLELSLSGAINRHQVTDPVTNRWQTVFLAADLDRFVAYRGGAGAGAELPPLQAISGSEYVSKAIAAERLGLSVRRVLELAAFGLIKRGSVRDPVTKRPQTAFSALDLERFIEAESAAGLPRYECEDTVKRRRLGAVRPGADSHWRTSLLLVCKVRDDGRVSGVVLRPHRSGSRKAWYTAANRDAKKKTTA